MAEMFLIDKKIKVDKPLTGSITKYDKVLLHFTTAWLIRHFHIPHNVPYLLPKILREHCFQFLLGRL